MTKRWLGAVFIVLGLSANAYSMQYTLETIVYPDAVWTSANGINNKGHVVGTYNDGAKTHGYIYNGNFTTVDFPGAAETSLSNINDSGKVVGWYNFNGQGIGFNNTYGFLYDNVAYYSVAFSDGQYGVANDISINGINNKDIAVGQYWVGAERGFTYDNGVISEKFPVYGEDINDNGVIVARLVEPGSECTLGNSARSCLIINGEFQNFNGLEGGEELDAYGINNLGQVVGIGELRGDEDFYGNFIYDGEKFVPLDLPGTVTDINDRGQIVGYEYPAPFGSGLAYIATPVNGAAVPEPSSMILLGLAIGGIFAAHRFSRGNTGGQLA